MTPDDLFHLESKGNDTVPSAHIIVIDTEGRDHEINPIKEACKQRYDHTAKLHFVVISRGMRRRARMQDDDTLQLDLNCLSKQTFLNTVASAAGLISADIVRLGENENSLAQSKLPYFSTRKNSYLLLVAEDNPINQRVINHQLSLLGLTAEMANDGQEALDMWTKGKGKYSLLLSDCHMPNMDGYTLASAIRQQEGKGEHIPIIALTADAMAGAKTTCLNAGMDDYMTKPLQIETLSKKLTEWLPDVDGFQSEPLEEPRDEHNLSINTSTKVDAINPRKLPEMLCSNDPNLLFECYHEFLLSAVETVDEICGAIEAKNLKAVVAKAHTLKSSAYTVGAKALADCCQLLETSGKRSEQKILSENVTHIKLLMAETHDWIVEKYPAH